MATLFEKAVAGLNATFVADAKAADADLEVYFDAMRAQNGDGPLADEIRDHTDVNADEIAILTQQTDVPTELGEMGQAYIEHWANITRQRARLLEMLLDGEIRASIDRRGDLSFVRAASVLAGGPAPTAATD